MFIRLTKLLLIFEILQKMVVVFACILVVSSETLAVRKMTRPLCVIFQILKWTGLLCYITKRSIMNLILWWCFFVCFFLVVVELCKPPWREEYGRKNTKDIDWAPLSD